MKFNARLKINKAARKLLQLVFGFDKWHISPLEERTYAMELISYCNQRKSRNFFVEIGCGLGDITRAADYTKKIGFDMDPKVLKAASWLIGINKKNTQFLEFRFPDAALPKGIDTLIMVNWIHHIEPELLRQKISEYFNGHLNNNGMIIIDTVQDAAYRFNHNIGLISGDLPCRIEKIGLYSRQRELWAIIKKD